MTISGNAAKVINDGFTVTHNTIKKGRLTHVWSSNYSNNISHSPKKLACKAKEFKWIQANLFKSIFLKTIENEAYSVS
jgi:hypothetical protein